MDTDRTQRIAARLTADKKMEDRPLDDAMADAGRPMRTVLKYHSLAVSSLSRAFMMGLKKDYRTMQIDLEQADTFLGEIIEAVQRARNFVKRANDRARELARE